MPGGAARGFAWRGACNARTRSQRRTETKLLQICRATALAAMLLIPALAGAHHGWSWTTGGNIQLTGIIVETNLGYPHGTLVIDADGERWTVEVGQP